MFFTISQQTFRAGIHSLLLFSLSGALIFAGCKGGHSVTNAKNHKQPALQGRERVLINDDWRFMRYTGTPDTLKYDVRPEVTDRNDNVVADSKPTESVAVTATETVLKKWVLPSGNDFIKDPAKQHLRPGGDPGADFPFVQCNFDDKAWESITLPHDWAIKGPFYTEANAIKLIYLDMDGAMSYTMVWLNGHLVGGWPYGYNSFRLDLTPYLKADGDNQLAIRLDNPTNSARWYPGGGIYRNVWLTKVNPVHVAQWGTFITTRNVSAASATVDIVVRVANKATTDQPIEIATEIYTLNANVTLQVLDAESRLAPRANNRIQFDLSGPGEIVATDNGDPADLESFPAKERKAYMGMAIVIIRAKRGAGRPIKVTAQSPGLVLAETIIQPK